jgi:hypothetical protein
MLIPGGGITAFPAQDNAVIDYAAAASRVRLDLMGLLVAEMESVTARSTHLPLTVPGFISGYIRECHFLLLSARRLARHDSD